MVDRGWARAFRTRAAKWHDLSKITWRVLVPQSTQFHKERMATRTPASPPRVRVVRKHHVLVRVSHWLNVPLLLGLIVSGISIYWSSPIYRHNPDPQTGSSDYLADAGI